MTMRKFRLVGRAQLVVVALLLLTGAGFARAEDRGKAPPPGPKNPPPVQMSASQQMSVGKAVVSRGQDLAQRLMHMVDEARREGDMIRLACLNDKLTQANANVTTAQGRLEALSKAVDADSRGHEFTVLTVIGQKFQTLDQEANQCVGQDLYETGATKVQTEINNDMLPFDQSSGSTPVLLPPAVPEIPSRASGAK